MKKVFLLLGLLTAIGFLTVGVLLFGVLSPRFSSSSGSANCLSPGTWRPEKVYLDSMLYVNDSEANLLQRLNMIMIDKFLETRPVTLDSQVDIGQEYLLGSNQDTVCQRRLWHTVCG